MWVHKESESICDCVMVFDNKTLLEQLKNKLKENRKLRNIDKSDGNYFLLRFLHACECDVETAYAKLVDYYKVMESQPAFFNTERLRRDILESQVFSMSPGLDKEGRPIFLFKLSNVFPETSEFLNWVHGFEYVFEWYSHQNSKIAHKGACGVMDMADAPWRLIKWATPNNIKTVIKKSYSAPVRIYQVHFINANSVASTLIKLVWPFFNDKMKSMLKFHFEDISTMYEYIDLASLPPVYGGTASIVFKELFEDMLTKEDIILANLRSQFSLKKSEIY